MAPHLNLMMKMHSQLRQDRNADLAYETTMFELTEKKREAKEEIDNADKVAQVTQDLSEIDRSDTDIFAKQQAVAVYGMNNPHILNKSAAAKLVYAAMNDSLKAQAAKKASFDKDKGSLYQIAQVGGMTPEQFDASINADGTVTKVESDLAVLNKTKYDDAQRRLKGAQATAGAEHEKERRAGVRTSMTDRLKELDDIAKYLDQIGENTPTTEMVIKTEGKAAVEQPISADAQTTWQKNQLEGLNLGGGTKLGRVSLADAHKLVMELRSKARSSASSSIRAAEAGGSGSSVGRKKPISAVEVQESQGDERADMLQSQAQMDKLSKEIEEIRAAAIRKYAQ
jgi:hypothetical protein|tara:strand:+ start:247 stop:1266 length:1020 start_codon:yes stop_codon:yes gene_type:complete